MEQKNFFEAASVYQNLKKAMFVSSAAVTLYMVSMDRYDITRGMSSGIMLEKNMFLPLAPFVLSGASMCWLGTEAKRLYCNCHMALPSVFAVSADKLLKILLFAACEVFIILRILRLSVVSYFAELMPELDCLSIMTGYLLAGLGFLWMINRLPFVCHTA